MIVAIVGPTATGKSELALDLAQTLASNPVFQTRFSAGVEIINADAFALYRLMNIGTAKTPPEKRRGIAHHQVDVLWPDEEASVATYQRRARADVQAVWSRHALPLVVGGSGLYVRALLDKLTFPPTDPQVRKRWSDRCQREGTAKLHEVLTALDPQAARVIEVNNARRLVRALEVIELTGKPFTATLPRAEYWHQDTRAFYLTAPTELLDERIRARCAEMFENGLVEEVSTLLSNSLHHLGVTALKATGYREAIALLRGEISEEQAREQTFISTRQLARRQIKWFRRDNRLVSLQIPVEASSLAKRILSRGFSEESPS